MRQCFVEDSDGSVLVIDEWDSEESFQSFFSQQTGIKELAGAG